jgi:peptidoglycan/LPS O-acetylase OafA/YrhL
VSKLAYYPRLDGLRALAIAGVLLDHFVHTPWIHSWGPGAAGVRLFFVLSGFLITSILLVDRDRSASLPTAAAQFYWRRFLRLSPALYVAIAGAALLDIAGMRRDWWVHALYLTNFKLTHWQNWSGAAHFWTLSVEEQFYLVWFLVVAAAPRRLLVPISLVCLAVGPVYRAFLPHDTAEFTALLLPGQIDSLGLGALLACGLRSPALRRMDEVFASGAALIACGAAALVLSLPLHWPWAISWVVTPIAINLAAACAVRRAVMPYAGGAADILAWGPVRHIGRISYGLYVYHYFVPQALDLLIPGFISPHSAAQKLTTAVIAAVVSWALAELSWRLIEQPALRLKDAPWRPASAAGSPTVPSRARL